MQLNIHTQIQQTQQASIGRLWDWQPVLRGPLQFPFLLGADCRRRLTRKKNGATEKADNQQRHETALDSVRLFEAFDWKQSE